jgi:hypothetical protein
MMSVNSEGTTALRRLQRPGIIAGLDIGQRRDNCALVVARHLSRRVGKTIEHRWIIIDAWCPPLGTRSSEAAPMIRDRLARHDNPHLIVDATGIGDSWIDHLVACGVTPALAVVVGGPGIGLRWSLDRIGERDITRVTAPRHPGGSGDIVSLLGALETGLSIVPGDTRPPVAVDPGVANSETGETLRAQLAGLAWRKGRPDHDGSSHDDLAFALALALALWASGFTPGATRVPRPARIASAARRSLNPDQTTYASSRHSWLGPTMSTRRRHG